VIYLASISNCTLTRASRRLQKNIATAAPLALSRKRARDLQGIHCFPSFSYDAVRDT
jgi:hypothetical protein